MGIGGLSPHPARGPITALRILGRGFEIAVDANRADRLGGTAGDRFTVKGELALALDEPTHKLVQPLAAYCGIGAHDDVDRALAAILWRRPIVLHGERSTDVIELARTIHDHSIRKSFPFTQISAVPAHSAAIEALCSEAGCGTILLDLTQPFELPEPFVRHLFSDYFHLWILVVASTTEDARRCFGPAVDVFPFCALGFRRTSWHRSMRDVTFT